MPRGCPLPPVGLLTPDQRERLTALSQSTIDQRREGRFAGAAGTGDGHPLSRLDDEIEALDEGRAVGLEAERDVAQLHAARRTASSASD